MKKNRLIILGLIVVLALLYTVLFNMSSSEKVDAKLMSFSKDNFVEAEILSDTNHLAASNNNYQLFVDETTSHFKVVDVSNGVEWYSNPYLMDPWQLDLSQPITNSALDKQKSTLELTYFNHTGSLASLNNYEYSISHPASVLYSAGLRTYSISYTDTGFQVLYVIEDVDIDYLYFPKFISPEVLESLDNHNILEAIAYTGYDEDLNLYEITQYEDMSRLVRSRLYDVFYGDDSLNYTREQAIAENASYGYTETFEKVRFEIAVDVSLTASGVKTSIIQNSIVESGNVKLATVSLFPYFGAAISEIDKIETEGYIVLPDGSGAVIEFNNGKNYQQPYSKRLYGDDLAVLDHKMAETQEKISIPLYGMIKDNAGFAAIITEGDAMATLNADVSGRIDSYNKVFTSFNFRENESVTLGSGGNQYGLDLWTEDRVQSDFVVEYTFLNGSDANYVGIAKVYQEYLETEFGFTSVDNTTDTILTTELLGSYDKKDFFMGVPYYTNESLTTFEQAEELLRDFFDRDITNINVIYKGMLNGGLGSSVSDQFKIEKVLGGKRDYKDLLQFSEANNIVVTPEIRVLATSEYDKMFDKFRYTSSRIDGSQSMIFNYHLPSKLPYIETPFAFFDDDYVISPYFYEEITKRFIDDYDGNCISFALMGSTLGGDYSTDMLYKQDSLRLQSEVLSNIDEELTLSSPLGFAFSSSSFITNLPFETTLYAILDYQIPLLQLVLSGKIDYSTVSLNMANERTTQYNFLKTIESGSNLKYTLSFDDSQELRDTEFSFYISTQYTNWIDRIELQVKELDSLGIHEGYLVGHEKIQKNVFLVTYSTGLEIIINYNLSDITTTTGIDVESLNYVVLEVD